MELLNKIVFLTGGSLGIGLECARRYKEAGAKLMIMSNDRTSLAQTLDELGDQHSTVFGDVSVAQDVKSAIQNTLGVYGRIDIIHNNAGIAHPAKPLHETSIEEWQSLIDVNLKSIYYTCLYGIDALKASNGCIINTGSLVGEIGQESHAAYAATKGAVSALTKSMALDYAPFQIRVNAVAPAGVWTPMLRKWNREQDDSDKIERYLDAIHPLGYCPEGDVIADVCVFLASEKARFITGCIVPVSGGAELGYRKVL